MSVKRAKKCVEGFHGEVFTYSVFDPGVLRMFNYSPASLGCSRSPLHRWVPVFFYFHVSFVPILHVSLSNAIALASADSAVTAEFSAFHFPSSFFLLSVF